MTVQPVGDEMFAWSDLDSAPGPVRGRALAPLMALARGRTLVAGPHDPTLLPATEPTARPAAEPAAGPGEQGGPASQRLTELTLLVRGMSDAEALADSLDATVYCGSPAKLPIGARFDTVLALDGLERLGSTEAAPRGWGETLAALVAVLAPGGVLVLGVENLFGLHRIVAPPRPPSDMDWAPGAAHDPTRPTGPAALGSALVAAGLDPVVTYAAYPDPVAPEALLSAGVLADGEVRGWAEATLAQTFAFHARIRRGAADDPAVLRDPATLAVDAARHDLATALAPGWIVVARRAPATGVTLPDVLTGDAALRRAELPSGRTLESLVLDAALRRDLPQVRALLTRWQQGPLAAVPAGQVIVGPDGLTAASVGERADVLRLLAAGLLRGGAGPVWPAVAVAADLAAVLAAMTGREPAPADLAAEPPPRSLAELLGERDRLARALVEARAEARFHDDAVAALESEVYRARRTIALLSARGPARAGRAFAGGVRAVARRGRAWLPWRR
ncbi:hypothetical protein [Krasilnikovia sp. MM14-A1004]|uniref:hypothetical protein n=1 Tax=Krasilnikovia sp. MM14-A1004 TaxID=3373541 RepID=UPI00399C4DBA